MKNNFIKIALCSLLAAAPFAMATASAATVEATQADNVTISGTVVDDSGYPVPGVGVLVKETTTGTTTDLDGKFSLRVPADAVVLFTSVGFDDVEVAVNGRADLGTIVMKTSSTLLEELVVVGYGSQRKADLTGSVAIVDADEMKKVSHSNISTMLEGKVAGVQITSDGQPGADPSVRIRGLGSFGSTAPLYVVDGVPMGTTIRDFSPNDIETIQVLKDASAAAIYGSRAANGVIIITTKSGKKDQPMRIDYRGYVGVDEIRKDVYDVMDAHQYADYIKMVYANSNMTLPAGYDATSPLYLDPNKINTDWFDEMFKLGIRQNHNVNISGGGQNNTYNVALDYFNQRGTLQGAGPNYDRFTVRVNNTMDVKFVKLRTGIVYSHSTQDNMAQSNANEFMQGFYGAQFPIMKSALLMPPSILAYDESTWCLDDKLGAASAYSYDAYGYGTYYIEQHGDIRLQNPLLVNQILERNTTVDRVMATGTATVDLIGMFGGQSENHKLDYNLNLSYSRTFAKDFTFIPSFIVSSTNYLAKENETLTQGYRTYTDGLIENFITYDGKMGKHHLNVVAGHTFQRESHHSLTGTGTSMPEPYYLQVGNAAERNASSYESEHVLTSYIGRINYDYGERYLLQATIRRDGSSRLSSDGRWGWFPSGSVGWRIDKEPFFNVDSRLVSLLKLRASYGILGNENIGDYQFMDTMRRGDYTYSFGGNKVTGSAISNYVNTAIKWEKKRTLDVGLDYSMFNGQLEFNADWYQAVSEDLLYGVPVPEEAGATNTSVTMNAATMVNSGVEFAFAWHDYGHDLKYDISANLTIPRNRVTSLGMGESTYLPDPPGYCITTVGEEVGQWYGYVYEGIFQSQEEIDNRVNEWGMPLTQNGAQPGDVAYKDLPTVDTDGDGIPDQGDGTITADDRQVLGSGMPKVQFGLSFRLEYKGLDLNVSTFGAGGFLVADDLDMTLRSSYSANNKSVELLNAWTPENPSTTVPRVYYSIAASGVNNDSFSSRYLQDGTYWKIANVELGYNFPDKWFKGVISGLRLYVSGQNLATISKYRGYNIDFAGGTFTPGYNYCSYPTPRTFMLGLNVSF